MYMIVDTEQLTFIFVATDLVVWYGVALSIDWYMLVLVAYEMHEF